MSPGALVQALEARGVRITARGDGALLIQPSSVLSEADRAALRARKREVAELLRERQSRSVSGVDWTTVPLYALNKVLEIAVPFADVPLILAPSCRVAAELRARESRPGPVWCVCEVLDLLLGGVTPEDARKVAATKLTLGGAVTGVRRLSP